MNPERVDEAYVKNVFIRYLTEKKHAVRSEKTVQDPPDYRFWVDGREIAVEVTSIPSIRHVGERIESREDEGTIVDGIAEFLNCEIKDIPKRSHIFLEIQYDPSFSRVRKLKAGLIKKIGKLIVCGMPSPGFVEKFDIACYEIVLKVLDSSREDREGVISCTFMPKTSIGNSQIGLNAAIGLKKAILDKVIKTSRVEGPKWLVIRNAADLADFRTYELAFERIDVQHDFERIYLVDHRSNVFLLFDRAHICPR